MTRRGIVNTLVALIAILTSGGLAAVAVIDKPPSLHDSEPVVTGVNGRGSFAIESPQAPADTRPTVSPQPQPTTTAPASRAPVATLPAPPQTTVPPVTVAPIPQPPGMPVTNWPPVTPPPPPVVVQTGPASWRFEDKGVTVTASVSPTAPRVGDTITISFTTGGDGELCCRAFVFVGDRIIGHSQQAAGEPCPPPETTSGTASVVVAEPGPFRFDVQATRAPDGCVGPHIFTNVGLAATLQVLPA
jgi:hypothetical protein